MRLHCLFVEEMRERSRLIREAKRRSLKLNVVGRRGGWGDATRKFRKDALAINNFLLRAILGAKHIEMMN